MKEFSLIFVRANGKYCYHYYPGKTLFESKHVQETIRERERKRKFLRKFRMLSNQLCVTFRDKASADLELQ